MKAVIYTGINQVELVERPEPVITDPNQVIVHNKYIGICGSDIHNLKNGIANYPQIPCHEFVGYVEAVGSAVTRVKVGDRVAVEPHLYCGHCYPCRHGRTNICTTLRCVGSHLDGGCCEKFLTTEDKCYIIPEKLTMRQAALTEPFTIAGQVNTRVKTMAGDTMLIHGAGPIGIVVMAVARAIGAKVIISEINESRLEMARKFGCDYTINPMKEDLEARVAEITNGEGPNVIVDAAGLPSALSQAIRIVSSAGRIGNICFSDREVEGFQMINFIGKEIDLVGSRLQVGQFDNIYKNYVDTLIGCEDLITHVFPIEQGVEAFETACSGADGVGKVVIEIED